MLVNPATNSMDNIIYDDPATDPYNNTDEVPQVDLNHSNLNMHVGSGSYDIGHLFGTTGGGVAYSYSLCNSGVKGGGYSARDLNTTSSVCCGFCGARDRTSIRRESHL